MMEFDHLFLDRTTRGLIAEACEPASRIFLSPLTKGLSGAAVWLAKWHVSGKDSEPHVFKVGAIDKLEREYVAIGQVASVIQRGFPHFRLYRDDPSGTALLRQQFIGSPDGTTQSLKRFVQQGADPAAIVAVMKSLYQSSLHGWHVGAHAPLTERMPLGDALDWWTSRINLGSVAKDIGQVQLERCLERTSYAMTVDDIARSVDKVRAMSADIVLGPVHGDLHAENVLVESVAGGTNGCQVIDYGWTGVKWRAVDFLMMECSLKFVVAPAHVAPDDIIRCERILDRAWSPSVPVMTQEVDEMMHSSQLKTIVAGIKAVRDHAQMLGAADSQELYRYGLLLLTAGLASLPRLINRVAVFHSLAYQLQCLGKQGN